MDNFIFLSSVFQNPIGDIEDINTIIANANKWTKLSKGAITGKMKFVGTPKIVVVAEESSRTDVEIILNFGVSRCTPSDANLFDKQRGIEYARWRAEHHPVIRLLIPIYMSKADVTDLFHSVAVKLNDMFVDGSKNHELGSLPVEMHITGT